MKSEFERIQLIVSKVAYPGYRFEVSVLDARAPELVAVRVIYDEPDVMTGVVERQEGRWWLIGQQWQPGQIVQTCLKAVLTSLEHRCREHFTYCGRAVFGPHMNIGSLYSVSEGRAFVEPAPR